MVNRDYILGVSKHMAAQYLLVSLALCSEILNAALESSLLLIARILTAISY